MDTYGFVFKYKGGSGKGAKTSGAWVLFDHSKHIDDSEPDMASDQSCF